MSILPANFQIFVASIVQKNPTLEINSFSSIKYETQERYILTGSKLVFLCFCVIPALLQNLKHFYYMVYQKKEIYVLITVIFIR